MIKKLLIFLTFLFFILFSNNLKAEWKYVSLGTNNEGISVGEYRYDKIIKLNLNFPQQELAVTALINCDLNSQKLFAGGLFALNFNQEPNFTNFKLQGEGSPRMWKKVDAKVWIDGVEQDWLFPARNFIGRKILGFDEYSNKIIKGKNVKIKLDFESGTRTISINLTGAPKCI